MPAPTEAMTGVEIKRQPPQDAGAAVMPAADRAVPAQSLNSGDSAGHPAAVGGGPATMSVVDASVRDMPMLDASVAPTRCSGCAQETRDKADTTLHLHHVHMHVADRPASESFYTSFLAAEKVRLNDAADALHISPIVLLLDDVDSPPNSQLPTALQHVGFGSDDPAAWYEAAHARGVMPDTRGGTFFNTNETPTVGAPGSGTAMLDLLGASRPACFPVPDAFSYMYVLGPDQERIEVWSGAVERVNHVHFTTSDLAATVSWYQRFLGIQITNAALFAAFYLDDILFFYEPIGTPADYAPTDDHVLSHVAFSVTDLAPWLERAKTQGIEIVAEPALTAGFESFFVRGPDGLLIELVEAAPSPELCPPPTP